MLITTGAVQIHRLPKLLYLNYEKKYLLSPKNIGIHFFEHPYHRSADRKGQNE
jgi:hypothetical protein